MAGPGSMTRTERLSNDASQKVNCEAAAAAASVASWIDTAPLHSSQVLVRLHPKVFLCTSCSIDGAINMEKHYPARPAGNPPSSPAVPFDGNLQKHISIIHHPASSCKTGPSAAPIFRSNRPEELR